MSIIYYNVASYRKKRKLSTSAKIKIGIAIFLLMLVTFFLYLNFVVNPIIIEMSNSKVKSLAQKAVSSAIYEIIKNNSIYDSLINITRNDNGEILMISTNALQINMLTRELSRCAQTKLEVIGEQGIDIPIGTFSGLPIFVGRGPEVNIKLLPIGTISSSFVSEFVQAGINQTNHRIYLNVNSSVSVILPTAYKVVGTTTQMMICESIIIGKVPDTYLNSNKLEDMLDLVPSK